jgi:TetR/AcrR family transcriptional regulator, mexJK operon transcriptional repressor
MREIVQRRRPGRPVDAKRLNTILDAARAVFLDHGFEGFAIEDVAARAQVSKVTIYKHYGGKDALIGAVIGRESLWMERGAEMTIQAGYIDAQALAAYGKRLLRFLARPDVMALDARMQQAPVAYRKIVARYFAEGPARLMAALEQLVEKAVAVGMIDGHVKEAASTLLSLWLSSIPLPARLGLQPPPTAGQIDAAIDAATQRFLKAFSKE